MPAQTVPAGNGNGSRHGPSEPGFAVETRALSKRFGSTVALDRVDLAIPTGSVFGVIGPNGSGKTTLMRLLLDVIRPTTGEIRVLGTDPRVGGPKLRSQIGFLPGEPAVEGSHTGRRVLHDWAEISGPVETGRVEALADLLGLDLGRKLRTLSRGNRQKLALVQAFMHRPRLLVLDEPTSGLDPLVQQQFHGLVRDAVARGATVFLSSHVLSEVQSIADSVTILRSGKLVKVATVAQLRETAVRHLRLVTQGLSEAQVRERLAQVPELRLGGVTKLADPGAGAAMVLEVRGMLTGAVRPLVVVAAGLPLLDFTVEEPNLEEAVLELYGPNGARPVTNAATFHDSESVKGEHHRHLEQQPHEVKHRA